MAPIRKSMGLAVVLIIFLSFTGCAGRWLYTGNKDLLSSGKILDKNFSEYGIGVDRASSELYWSPKGNYIVFEGAKRNAQTDRDYAVVVADLVSNKLIKIKEGHLNGKPAWSADEKSLVVSCEGLYIYSTDTFSVNKIAEKGYSPSVSPDNKKIAYVSEGIWLYDVDKLTSRQLTKRRGDDMPLWFGDSKRLFYFRDTGKLLEGTQDYEQVMSILDTTAPDNITDVTQLVRSKFVFSEWVTRDENIYVESQDKNGKAAYLYNLKLNGLYDVFSGDAGYIPPSVALDGSSGVLLKSSGYKVEAFDLFMKRQWSSIIADDGECPMANTNLGQVPVSEDKIIFLHSTSGESDSERKAAVMLLQYSEGKAVQLRLTDYGSYTRLSVSPDKKRFALVEDSERLRLYNMDSSKGVEVKGLEGKASSFNELADMLPAKTGTEWTYTGFAEYGHSMKLNEIKDTGEYTREYSIKGKVSDPSGGMAKADLDISLKYVVTAQSIKERVIKGKKLPNKITGEFEVLRAPIEKGGTWKQKVRINGRQVELRAQILDIYRDKDTNKLIVKVEYSAKVNGMPGGVYRETREFMEGTGVKSFENTYSSDVTFNYSLLSIK